jgi:hypothetical protein
MGYQITILGSSDWVHRDQDGSLGSIFSINLTVHEHMCKGEVQQLVEDVIYNISAAMQNDIWIFEIPF